MNSGVLKNRFSRLSNINDWRTAIYYDEKGNKSTFNFQISKTGEFNIDIKLQYVNDIPFVYGYPLYRIIASTFQDLPKINKNNWLNVDKDGKFIKSSVFYNTKIWVKYENEDRIFFSSIITASKYYEIDKKLLFHHLISNKKTPFIHNDIKYEIGLLSTWEEFMLKGLSFI